MLINILMICGLYLVVFALLNHTRNFISGITYKVIPLFIGVALLLCAADLKGLVSIF